MIKVLLVAANYVEAEMLTRHIRREFAVIETGDEAESWPPWYDEDVPPPGDYKRHFVVDVYSATEMGNGDNWLAGLVAGIRAEVEADCAGKAERLAFLAAGWKRAARKYRSGNNEL